MGWGGGGFERGPRGEGEATVHPNGVREARVRACIPNRFTICFPCCPMLQREDNFQKVVAQVQEAKDGSKMGGVGKGKKASAKKETDHGESSDIFKVVKMVVERNLEPVR